MSMGEALASPHPYPPLYAIPTSIYRGIQSGSSSSRASASSPTATYPYATIYSGYACVRPAWRGTR